MSSHYSTAEGERRSSFIGRTSHTPAHETLQEEEQEGQMNWRRAWTLRITSTVLLLAAAAGALTTREQPPILIGLLVAALVGNAAIWVLYVWAWRRRQP